MLSKYLQAVLLFSPLVLSGCGSTSNPDITYVAMGASDVTSVGATPITNGYVYRIQEELENQGKETKLIPVGIPGAEIGAIRDIELPAAKRLDPDLVTLFTGPNDIIGGISATSFEDDLRKVIEDLQEDTSAFIVIATLPPIDQAPRFQSTPDADVTSARVAAFNEAILRVANEKGVGIADLRSSTVDQDVTAGDGYHPNDLGYEIIANIFLQVVLAHFQGE